MNSVIIPNIHSHDLVLQHITTKYLFLAIQSPWGTENCLRLQHNYAGEQPGKQIRDYSFLCQSFKPLCVKVDICLDAVSIGPAGWVSFSALSRGENLPLVLLSGHYCAKA